MYREYRVGTEKTSNLVYGYSLLEELTSHNFTIVLMYLQLFKSMIYINKFFN